MQAPSVNLAVTFATTSPFLSNPSSLVYAHPALHQIQYTKPAGELSDVLVFTVPRETEGTQRGEIVQALKGLDTVLRVDVLESRTRTKRDEFYISSPNCHLFDRTFVQRTFLLALQLERAFQAISERQMTPSKLRIAFIHPDLGIGGAERLVVDAALGLQSLGHTVDIYTSHHDPNHCFDETRDGTLRVHHVISPFPRAWHGKFHVLFAHARQLHLTLTQFLFRSAPPKHDVFFVDQLSTCIPLLRTFTGKRVLFYCHFPDKLLAHGAFVEGAFRRNKVGLLKTLYRYPMDWLEEVTTRQADTLVANSKFTARITNAHLSSITSAPKVVYPGINIKAYQAPIDWAAPDVIQITSQQVTLVSLNRFEEKKNAALAIESFALLREKTSEQHLSHKMRLVLAGGYDPRLEDNIRTLNGLVDRARSSNLSFDVITPPESKVTVPSFEGITKNKPDVLFLLNFTTMQRSALLQSSSTLALLYTPANEHFGIGPVEGMICGLPVLACNSGGPTESIVDQPPDKRTGWLRTPDPGVWADALEEIYRMDESARASLAERSKQRAQSVFGMSSMAKELETLLKETVEMGPVETWLLKGIGLMVAFLIGFALAVFSRQSRDD